VLNRLPFGFDRCRFGIRCTRRWRWLRRLDRRRVTFGRWRERCGFVRCRFRCGVANHRLVVLFAPATAPPTAAAATTPTPASAIVALTGLPGTVVARLRLGAETRLIMSRPRLRRLAVVDFFVAAAGDITGFTG